MSKTNAMRLLESQGVAFETREYEVDPEDLSAETVARKIHLPIEQVFKTLLARGDRNGLSFAVIPGDTELDLKALAKGTGDRKIDLVPVKELQPLTGYIRGGVTALAAKKDFPVYLDETAELFEVISVSAGQRGLQMLVRPQDYLRVTRAKVGASGKVATLTGKPVRFSVRRDLRCARGRILPSGGTPVHAATFIRRRMIVLDADLLRDSVELRRIVIHEVFHFVWVRLGNPARRSFERLLSLQRRAPGELGWSSEYRKGELTVRDWRERSRKWREYCCEAFCDTAAYLYARSKQHDEFTLAEGHRRKRMAWFGKNLGEGSVRI